MLHHLALFTPALYIVLGEILPSRSRKMRVKIKPLLLLASLVGLIALYGYTRRESSPSDREAEVARAAQLSLQRSMDVPLVAKVNEKQPNQRRESLPVDKQQEKSRGGANVQKVAKQAKSDEIEQRKPQKSKKFPDPISLKPQQLGQQQNQGQGQEQGSRNVGAPGQDRDRAAVQSGGIKKAEPPAPVQREEPNKEKQKTPDVSQQVAKGHGNPQEVQKAGDSGKAPGADSVIHLSVVCCGDRTNETLVMLKTATILTQRPLHFHIFAEDELQPGIAARLNDWPTAYRRKLTFDLYSISFPSGEDPQQWKKVFKMCATQRLFLPDLLVDVDSLLYVDTDILFIRPVDEIYDFFKQFNSTQLAAMAPEHEVKNIGWYNRFARHPYYGETGMNSGVMLMNLTRMRNFGWSQKIVPYYHEYKLKITWGDQDLINILFHFYPQGLFSYPCEWNYRPDHCMYSNNCHRTNEHGIAVIHGNRGVYHNEKMLAFRAIYESFRDYTFGADLEKGLIQPLVARFSEPAVKNTYCGKAVVHPVVSTLVKYKDQVTLIKGTV